MSTPSLPSYSNDSPSYSAQPRGGEQTLGGASRSRRLAEVYSHPWSKKVGHATLTLLGQPSPDSELPVYGRLTNVQGFVTLDSTEDVASVQIKLDGHIKCKTIAEIGSSDITVLGTSVILWTRGGPPCPSRLTFEISLPTTFSWKGYSGPLPPTFEYTFYDVQGGTPGLKAKIKYEIIIEVEHNQFSLKDKLFPTLSSQFVYLPRSRPGNPTSDSPTSVFESFMEHRVGSKGKEIDPIVWKVCSLCLPPPGTYAMSEPIPFRVSVTSRSAALLTPFAPGNKRERASIRVYILRQVSIKVNTIDLWRSYIVAEGELTYLPRDVESGELWLKNTSSQGKPPSVYSNGSVGQSSEREGWASLDWSGVLKIDGGQISTGGFVAGDMVVKDFVVLSVVPPNPRMGSLLEVKRVVPIQLTTDSWETGTFATSQEKFPIEARDASPGSNGYLEGRGEGHEVEIDFPSRNAMHVNDDGGLPTHRT
ncbi:hypothetical protein K439DRAFT_1080828 [Ramaria rubella]|nr:hypothetical protein K439DRAFT_1080828 [Ramaria rubella]